MSFCLYLVTGPKPATRQTFLCLYLSCSLLLALHQNHTTANKLAVPQVHLKTANNETK